VRFAGNRPPNVPSVTTNLWASYQDIGGLPIEVGGSLRVVGDRFANNANIITMNGYTSGDVYLAWTRNRLRVTARVDNVANTAYASWSDVFYLATCNYAFEMHNCK
jgi:iron complex outermembrane receptor protein